MGICDPLKNLENILSKKYYKADDLIREIFLHEGLNPDKELQLFRQVKRLFISKFGSDFL